MLFRSGKPFILVINSTKPNSAAATALKAELSAKYDVNCVCVNCLELGADDISSILKSVLYEFPVSEIGLYLPSWVDALPIEHELRQEIFKAITDSTDGIGKLRDIQKAVGVLDEVGPGEAALRDIALGTGIVSVRMEMPRDLY